MLTTSGMDFSGKSSNIISSPAASFDRIEITYGEFDKLIISPKHKTKKKTELEKSLDKVKMEEKIKNKPSMKQKSNCNGKASRGEKIECKGGGETITYIKSHFKK